MPPGGNGKGGQMTPGRLCFAVDRSTPVLDDDDGIGLLAEDRAIAPHRIRSSIRRRRYRDRDGGAAGV